MNQLTDPITFTIQHGINSVIFDFSRYAIASCGVAAIVWLLMRTRLSYRKIQARSASAADIRREVLQSIRSCFVYVGATVIVTWGMRLGILKMAGRSNGLASDLAMLAAIIVAHDAYFYWVHRAMHTPLMYKRFHLTHHRSITPTPFAAYSFSVGEAALMALFVVMWQFFVATPGIVLLIFLGFQILRNAMGHSGFEFHPRWWLSTPLTSWINTTTHHDLHHAGSFTHNYGLYFTFWDRLMGTEHPKYAETFTRVTTPPASTPEIAILASSPGQ